MVSYTTSQALRRLLPSEQFFSTLRANNLSLPAVVSEALTKRPIGRGNEGPVYKLPGIPPEYQQYVLKVRNPDYLEVGLQDPSRFFLTPVMDKLTDLSHIGYPVGFLGKSEMNEIQPFFQGKLLGDRPFKLQSNLFLYNRFFGRTDRNWYQQLILPENSTAIRDRVFANWQKSFMQHLDLLHHIPDRHLQDTRERMHAINRLGDRLDFVNPNIKIDYEKNRPPTAQLYLLDVIRPDGVNGKARLPENTPDNLATAMILGNARNDLKSDWMYDMRELYRNTPHFDTVKKLLPNVYKKLSGSDPAH